MYKSGKITIEIVIVLIGTLAALITATLKYKESKKPLIADVNCVPWKSPQALVTKIKAIGDSSQKAIDVNDMCSMYAVNIHNKDKDATEETQMSIPSALYWEVSWLTEKRVETREYSGNELITLPDIYSGRDVNVKVWAACKAARPCKKEFLITQKRSYPARLNIIAPVRESIQFLDQLISNVWIYLFLSVGIILISIKMLIKKRHA